MSGTTSSTTSAPATEAEGRDLVAAEIADAGARLDAHHAPETNGRMAICRRCGSRTDTPVGLHHVPDVRQVARSSEWLDAQVRASRIGHARGSLGT